MDDELILKELQEFYHQASLTEEGPLLDHLSNEVSLRSYIKKGREVADYLKPGATVLDWGAGFGQMTLILTRLGFHVVPFDVIVRRNNMFAQTHTQLILGQDPVKLPFPDNSFAGVISCGVLEHVEDVNGSTAEIFRVLEPGGQFFIFNLPYLFSPSEYYATLKKISVHPLKFTKFNTRRILKQVGFRICRIGHENGFPKRLSGPLRRLRPFFNNHQNLLLKLDSLIVSVPGLRSVLSNSIKAVAQKPLTESGAGSGGRLHQQL